MNWLANNTAESLAEWLGIAAGNLATPGRRRIGREIEAHFTEAVRAHVANGEAGPEAHASAMRELGDPYVAAKRFRRSHLTETEAYSLSILLKGARQWSAFFLKLLAPSILLVAAGLSFFPQPQPIFYALMLVWLLLPALSRVLAGNCEIRTKACLLLFFESVEELLFGFVIVCVLLGPGRAIGPFWVFGLIGIPGAIGKLRLSNKVWRSGEVGGETAKTA